MIKIKDKYEFITFDLDGAEMIFSTSKNDLNFNKNIDEGKKNLNLLTKYFNLQGLGYTNQIHSDLVVEYNGNIEDGDAIVTDKKNIGVGVFTADCVPVLIYDKSKKVAAAVHSGWKGTYQSISTKTMKYMVSKYGCKIEDMIVYIGPHNRACCYEFGSDAANKYFKDYIKQDETVYVNNKLNIEKCIIHQLINVGVSMKNIKTLNLCTYCNTQYSFHSYRKQSKGRMFSFVVIR